MNEFWIINENQNLSNRLKDEIQEAGISKIEGRELELEWLLSEMQNMLAPGCICFLVIDSIEPRHMIALEQLSSISGAKVVVIAPTIAPDTVLTLFRSGASDVLTVTESFRQDFIKLLSRLNASTGSRTRVGKTISFLSTTCFFDSGVVSVNTAASLAAVAGSCGLIDLHLDGGVLASMLGRDPQHTIHDLIKKNSAFDDTMIGQIVSVDGSGVRLFASSAFNPSREALDAKLCGRIVEYASLSLPYTVVHVDHPSHREQLRAVLASDATALVVQLTMTSVAHASETIRFLTENGVHRDSIHIVVLKRDCDTELPLSDVKKVLSVKQFFVIPDNRPLIIESVNLGIPAVRHRPNDAMCKKLSELAEHLAGCVSNQPGSVQSDPSIINRIGGVFRTFANGALSSE